MNRKLKLSLKSQPNAFRMRSNEYIEFEPTYGSTLKLMVW
jgi:hypothetical protein